MRNHTIPYIGLILLVSMGFSTILNGQVADTSQYFLNEIQVTGKRGRVNDRDGNQPIRIISKKEISESPVNNINDLLDQYIELDLRQRGAVGIQADPSLRGGSFDQVAILLNGVNMTDAQTGHFSLDIPVPLSMISRIEILSGPGAKLLGINSLSGAINIITLPPDKTGGDLNLSAGQYGLLDLSASVRMVQSNFYQQLSASRQSSSGYIDNTDFKKTSLYFQAGIMDSSSNLRFEGGWMNKAFGANSFYTPIYPNQFEEISSKFGAITWQLNKKVPFTTKVYYRGHTDRFELFRADPPAWYNTHNYHLNQMIGASSSTYWQSGFGQSLVNLEVKYDWIWSTVLGDPDASGPEINPGSGLEYDHFGQRWFGGASFEQVWSHKRLILDGGLSLNYYQAGVHSFQILPSVTSQYQLGHGITWITGINRSFRLPTYTELYYSSPTNQGNPTLLPETGWEIETGIKRSSGILHGSITGFYRYSMQSIDWVKRIDETVWQSKNHSDISTFGAEANLLLKNNRIIPWINPRSTLETGLRYTTQNADAGEFISKYVLDYLKWKWTLKTFLPVGPKYSITLNMSGQLRNGTHTSYHADGPATQEKYPYYWLMDARISRRTSRLNLFIEARNILNIRYFDLDELYQPGRWIQAGIQVKIDR